MNKEYKCYELLKHLIKTNTAFRTTYIENIKTRKIRLFNEEEWTKINNQNFTSLVPGLNEFSDMFKLGYNIGNCVGTARQLSYSYDDVDIVSGTLPILKGTLNAEKEGGHCWLETADYIIDTSLMLVIDKSLKQELGYNEEQRLTSFRLQTNAIYQSRKEFTNDINLKSPSKRVK